jgi:hypothetical protein
MRYAGPALEQLLDIIKHVIAVFDISLHALAQPISCGRDQKAKRSRKFRLSETIRDTIARSASVLTNASIKST